MKKFIGLLFVAGILFVFSVGPASAARQAFGVFGGLTFSNISDPDIDADVDGTAFGADFQIDVAEDVTVNPFLMISSETGTADFGGITFDVEADLTIIGAEVRFWFDDIFVGPLIGQFDGEVTLSGGGGSLTASDTAIGIGGVFGWESEQGLSVRGMIASVAFDDSVDYFTTRILVGFRF